MNGENYGKNKIYEMKYNNILSKTLLIVFSLFVGYTMQAQISDSFTDGDFTANPVWSGDTGQWDVNNNSTAGAGVSGSMTLRLDGPSSPRTTDAEYLSTPFSDWKSSQIWSFFLGRRGQTYTGGNKVYIWLYANESTLESATVDGYRIRIGETGSDHFHLESVTNGTGTTILSSAAIGATSDFGVDLKIERTLTGEWTMYTSVLPLIGEDGARADEDPLVKATVDQGSVTNTVYTPSGSGFVGIVGHHTSSSTARNAIEFDQFVLTTISNDTKVEFDTPLSASYPENTGVISFPVTIEFESATVSTTVDVVLVSGDATRINNYTTQTLTFVAGSSSSQNVSITITNNSLCDENEILEFELQNVSGGTSATIGANDTYVLTVRDDESGFNTVLEKDFEDAEIDEWTQSGSSSWDASNTSPITGSYSLRHHNNGSAGISSASVIVDNASLRGLETIWDFNFNYYGHDPSPNNNFLIYLTANETDLTSASVDGYAVGVRPPTMGAADNITLWKMVDGVATTAIVTSSYDLDNSDYEIGIRVKRDENGVWELLIDNDGGMDNLVSEGTATNLDFLDFDYFGIYYKYTSSLSGKLAIDDIDVRQEGCKLTYYSQSSGNIDGAIWAETPVGVPSTIKFNRFLTMVVQNTHDVTMNLDAEALDLTIENGGTWIASTNELKVYGNFDNSGTFAPGTSKIYLCGDNSQEIGGSSTTQFNDLLINNIGGDVIQTGDIEMKGVFKPNYGEYDTDGNNLTLISNSSGTGSIGSFEDDAELYGEITMQRYVPADVIVDGYPGGWVRLGNSLTGATISDWDDNLLTTGFTGADYEYSEYPFVNIYHYDETNIGAAGLGWIGATNITNALSSTQGYAVYMLGEAQSIDITGDFQQRSITHNLDYTNTGDAANDGWNLVVNRYPSEIDFNDMYSYSSGITSYSVWDTETASYLVYNASTGMGSGSRYIPSSQPFWVQATAGAQFLQYEEDIKSNTGVDYERDYTQIEQVEISINQGIYQDRTFIGFMEEASVGFDAALDLRKIEKTPQTGGLPLLISSMVNEEKMSINVLPELIDELSIPVNITIAEPGDVTIVIENILGLPNSSCLVLEDLVLNETHQLNQGEEFTFTVEEAYQGTRFLIHFGSPIQIKKEDISCNGDSNGFIIAQGSGDGPFDYIWFDENDEVILEESSVSGSSTITDLVLGNYTVEISSTNGFCGTISETIYIDEPQEQQVSISTEPDYCYLTNPGVIVIEVENSSVFNYEISNEEGIIVLEGSSAETVVEEFEAGLYQVTVITSCNLFEFQADLRDPNAVTVSIEEDEVYLNLDEGEVSMFFAAEFNNPQITTWTIDGEIISTEESFDYTFNEIGDYYAMVIVENENGCYASDEQIIHITEVVDIEDVSITEVTMIQRENSIEIQFENSFGHAHLEVINMMGQTIIRTPVVINENETVRTDISVLSSGAYIIRVVNKESNIFSRKIIK